jgi:Rrf2 family protein
MLKLSKKTEYAIIALTAMRNGNEAKLYTAKELSQKYSIPPEIMGKVMQSLVKNNIIVSHQGVKGGYQLKGNLSDINVISVITAVEGPLQVVDCVSIDECECNQISSCNIKGPMEMIQNELQNFFNNISLKDLIDKYTPMVTFIE